MTAGGGDKNIINLAALAVPIMPTTAGMEAKVAEAGAKAGVVFQESFRAAEAGEGLGDKMARGLLQGFQKSDLGGKLQGMMGGLNLEKLGVVAGFTAAVLAAEKLGKALIDVGEEFEGINRQVELTTTASGPALESMKAQVDNLVGSLDTGTKNLGADFGILSQRLHLWGDELSTVTRHVEEMRDRFGQLNLSNLAGAMIQFGVAAGQTDNTLASLVNSSREFGVSLDAVIGGITEAGPQLRELGLNAEQAGHMMAEMTGIGLGGPAGAQMLARAEKANIETNKATGLHRTLSEFILVENESIKKLSDSGDEAGAQQASFLAYGLRNWPLATTAAQAYADTVAKPKDAFKANAHEMDELAESTKTLTNRWNEFANILKLDVEPAAKVIVDTLSKGLDTMTRWLNGNARVLEILGGVAGFAVGGIPGFVAGAAAGSDASGGAPPSPPGAPSPPAPPGAPAPQGGLVSDPNAPGGWRRAAPAPGVALKDRAIGTDPASLRAYIISKGQQLGLTPTEIGMALAVQTHEGLGPTGNPSMGFGPEAKAQGFNFDQNPVGAIDQFYKQYKDRLPAGLNRNDPNAIANYIWHTVHGAADTNYGPELLTSYSGPAGGPSGGPAPGGGVGGLNLSTIPVAVQKYANDCIDASARIILSHAGINMDEDQLEGVIAPGGSIQSQAAGLNKLNPKGGFVAMPGSGGSQQVMFNAIKASVDRGVGSILNVAPGSSLAGRNFGEGHFIAVTGYNADGTINVSDTAGGKTYTVSAADAFQATAGRGIVAGTGSGPTPSGPGGGGPTGSPFAGQGGSGGVGNMWIPTGIHPTLPGHGAPSFGSYGGFSFPGGPASAPPTGAPVPQTGAPPGTPPAAPPMRWGSGTPAAPSAPAPPAPSGPSMPSFGGRGHGHGGAPDPNATDARITERNRALRDANRNLDDAIADIKTFTEEFNAAETALAEAKLQLSHWGVNTAEWAKQMAVVTADQKTRDEAWKRLHRAQEDLPDKEDAVRIAGDKSREPIGGKGGGGNAAEQFGSGLLKGLFEAIGLPDVKSPLEWGTTKLGMGVLNWALSGIPSGRGQPGQPFQGGVPQGGGLPGAGLFSTKPGGPGGPGNAAPSSFSSLYVDKSINVTQVSDPSMDSVKAFANSYQHNAQVAAAPGAVPAQ